MIKKLTDQSKIATKMLKGKIIKRIIRHTKKEVLIEFTDGTRLFVDQLEKELELSITER